LPIARPINVVLYNNPYFGVFVFYFKARKRAFSAPKICMVDAGYLARVLNDPECAISFAATLSPIKLVKFGETIYILSFKYPCIYLLN
jgi:hypothetical protein